MTKSIIAALDRNAVIGKDNKLPWHLPADLQFFKRVTMGHHLIMGRKTYEAIGRPLPGRTTIVVTRSASYLPEKVLIAPSLDDAFALASGDDEMFIAGGAEIFRQCMDVADRLYLTRIDESFDGDTFFPSLDEGQWSLRSREAHLPDERNRYPYAFELYVRAARSMHEMEPTRSGPQEANST